MATAPITDREPALPAEAQAYRHLGPFDADAIPKGLWGRHALKDGVWGMLSIEAGSIGFRWDDAQGGGRLLSAGDVLLIPPTVPHHLDHQGPVTITLAFCAIPETAAA